MSSLDDQLRTVLRSTAPPAQVLSGDVDQVKHRVARRRQVRRAAAGLGGAAVLATGFMFVNLRNEGSNVSTDGRDPVATGGTVPPLGSDDGEPVESVRDVDFANSAYQAPCPSFTGYVTVTLSDGTMSSGDEDNQFVVELKDVTYTDADADGDEDAVVALSCHHPRAEQSAVWAGVYGLDAEGRPEIVGTPLTLDDAADPSLVGEQLTVTIGEDQQVWGFDGEGFQRLDPPTDAGDTGQPGSIRDVDFRNRSYQAPCPVFTGDATVTLIDGTMSSDDEDNQFIVELASVAYSDADGDGDEDAQVALLCHHPRAEQSMVWVGAFVLRLDGEPEPFGTPLTVDTGVDPSLDGRVLMVTVDADPNAAPSGQYVRRTYEFDGEAFRLVDEQPL